MRSLRHTFSLLAASAIALAFSACGPEEEEPTCDACFTPPASICEGAVQVDYELAGVCIDGECGYPETRTECGGGCEDGACVSLCDGNECLDVPAPSCDGTSLTTYEPQGVCDDSTGECTYTTIVVDCTLTDEVCTADDAGARCDEPPAACDDGTMNGSETDVDCGGDCGPCPNEFDCEADEDCESGICARRVCVEEACDDGVTNGAETDVDCGGDACAECQAGQSCSVGADCGSGVCDSGLCLEANCEDGIMNGDETGADCGGRTCAGCPLDEACLDSSDCESLYCSREVCTEPSCDDRTRNGTESDIDCGGDCSPCGAGFLCAEGADCRSDICDDEVCVAESCIDGLANGDETDVDCGGAFCAACDGGLGCLEPSDCSSRVCIDGLCSEPSCDDSLRNGGESGVDCGGECPACGAGETCRTELDCESGVCTAARCVSPRCTDGVLNQDESDVDCGGPTCDPCDVGGECAVNADCMSNICEGGFCSAAPTCDDGLLGPGEADVDCGGVTCDGCGIGRRCFVGLDCLTGNCVDGVCGAFPTCGDGAQNGSESGVDCGGPDCPACGVDEGCRRNDDCTSLVCDLGACAVSTCGDGVQGLGETGVDCGGPCDPCAAGSACRDGSDCDSGICTDDVCAAATCTDGVQNGTELGIDCGGDCPESTCLIECVSVTAYNMNEAAMDGFWRLDDASTEAASAGFEAPAGCAPGADSDAPEAVFRFQAPLNGTYNFTTGGFGSETEFDTVLYLLDGGCIPEADVLVCNDDLSDVDDRSTVEADLDEGQIVFIVADSYSSAPSASVSMLVRDVTAPGCDNRRRDGTETDIDCGGRDCAPCDDGGICDEARDCVSRVCRENTCFEPTCDDGVRNGDELIKDCGVSCGDEPEDCILECADSIASDNLNSALLGDFGTISGSLTTAPGRMAPPRECTGFATGAEFAYQYLSSIDGQVQFQVQAAGFEPVLYFVERICDSGEGALECGLENPDIDGFARVVPTLEDGYTYFLFVDSIGEVTDPAFTVTVSLVD